MPDVNGQRISARSCEKRLPCRRDHQQQFCHVDRDSRMDHPKNSPPGRQRSQGIIVVTSRQQTPKACQLIAGDQNKGQQNEEDHAMKGATTSFGFGKHGPNLFRFQIIAQ